MEACKTKKIEVPPPRDALERGEPPLLKGAQHMLQLLAP